MFALAEADDEDARFRAADVLKACDRLRANGAIDRETGEVTYSLPLDAALREETAALVEVKGVPVDEDEAAQLAGAYLDRRRERFEAVNPGVSPPMDEWRKFAADTIAYASKAGLRVWADAEAKRLKARDREIVDFSKPPEPVSNEREAEAAMKAGKDPRGIVLDLGAKLRSGDISKEVIGATTGLPEAEVDRLTDTVEVPTLSAKDPQKTAKEYRKRVHTTDDGTPILWRYRDEFYTWNKHHYAVLEEATVRAEMAKFLTIGGVTPNSGRLSNAIDLLECESHVPGKLEPPCYLGERPAGYPDPLDLIQFKNGLLDPGTRTLYPSTPHLFNLGTLPFDYRPEDDAEPEEWLKYLEWIWPDDDGAVSTLQEIFGYLLTPDNRFQKIFLMVGQTRSGKGTIADVLRWLLGEENVAAMTLDKLTTNFGLSLLKGKSLGILADARLSGQADTQVVAERLLSISGNDPVPVEEKYKAAESLRLRVRFFIMSNITPRLTDPSSALPGRFIPLQMARTFKDNVIPNFGERFIPELPRILHWALRGRESLLARGKFVIPHSAMEVMREFEDIAAPVRSFVEEMCIVGEDEEVKVAVLYALWCEWNENRGRRHVTDQSTFRRDLRIAEPSVISNRRGVVPILQGIGIRPQPP